MPSTRRVFCLAALAAFVLILAGPAWAAKVGKIKVGSGGIATIQQAVDQALASAEAEDVISIPPGVYDENVYVTLTGTPTQTRLTLQRSGKGDVLIRGVGGGASAIVVQDAKNITLKNLTVQSGNAVDGVPALKVSGEAVNIVVQNVNGVAGDDVGVAISGNSTLGAQFKNCSFSGMTTAGFSVDGNGHLFDNCTANDCGENGFVLAATSTNCVILNSKALGAGPGIITHPGVITVRGSGHRIEKTFVSGGARDGFYLEGAGHRLVKCSATNNLDAGIFAEGVPAQFDSCTASDNLYGFVGGADGALLDGGVFSDNTSHGLLLTVSGTNIRAVKADKNTGNGVLISTGVERTTLTGNSFKSNFNEAVVVDGDKTFLDGNKATGSGGFVDHGLLNGGRNNKASSGATNDFP